MAKTTHYTCDLCGRELTAAEHQLARVTVFIGSTASNRYPEPPPKKGPGDAAETMADVFTDVFPEYAEDFEDA